MAAISRLANYADLTQILHMDLLLSEIENRAIVRIEGDERQAFLQNLLTQNLDVCTPNTCHMAALLTPQGKMAFDFLIYATHDAYLLDCDSAIVADLMKRLTLYKLRAKVDISLLDIGVWAIWQADGQPCPPQDGFYPDPRHAGLGLRGLFAQKPNVSVTDAASSDWQALRLRLGVPEGHEDMPNGKIFPLEFGLAQMGGVDFQKGCFVGQEVTSRTHRKGTLRKKLWPLQFQQQAPAEGSRIVTAKQRPCGEIVTASGSQAIALIREDALGEELLCEGAAFQRLDGLFS